MSLPLVTSVTRTIFPLQVTSRTPERSQKALPTVALQGGTGKACPVCTSRTTILVPPNNARRRPSRLNETLTTPLVHRNTAPTFLPPTGSQTCTSETRLVAPAFTGETETIRCP